MLESILGAAAVIATFCLGVAVGAVLERRYGVNYGIAPLDPVEISEILELYEDSPNVSEIEPMDVSLAQQLIKEKCQNITPATPVDWEFNDPEITMELPAYDPDDH